MFHLFVINPLAGGRDKSQRIKAMITDIFSHSGKQFAIEETRMKDHGTQIVRTYDKGKPLRVYACGGDGTLNEVLNASVGKEHIEITNYPNGSGNDFIRSFDNHRSFYDLVSLTEGQRVTLDVIKCNERYAMNTCCTGLDADIAADIQWFRRIPVIGGSMSYVTSIAANLLKPIGRHHKVTIDGKSFDGAHTMIAIMNGRFYGGGFNPAPKARQDDGKLDFIIVNKVNQLQVLGLIKHYKSGEITKIFNVISYIVGQKIYIESDRKMTICHDGEVSHSTTIDAEVVPKGVNFVVPRQ